jgi:hypothetical protein
MNAQEPVRKLKSSVCWASQGQEMKQEQQQSNAQKGIKNIRNMRGNNTKIVRWQMLYLQTVLQTRN